MIQINYQINAVRLPNENSSRKFRFEMTPKCPRCHTGNYFRPTTSIASSIKSNDIPYRNIIGIPLSCPSCGDIFISVYAATDEYLGHCDAYETVYIYSGPSKLQCKSFSSKISLLSPSFCKLYEEAQTAEYCNLESLAGMGYRKALEHLIKDFAIRIHPESKQKIEDAPLSQCINNYVHSDKLVATALRCAWLGNDYAHYLKKFTDHDLENLKAFLDATVYWVSMELITEEALQLSPR